MQGIVLTMFRDAHTDGQTDGRMHGRTGQNHFASGHTTLDGGTKIEQCTMTIPKEGKRKRERALQEGVEVTLTGRLVQHRQMT